MYRKSVLSENSVRLRFSQRFSLLCGKQFPVPKADSPGNDYSRIDNFSFEDCRRACANDFQCNAFTYNQAKYVCFLKTAPNQWVSLYAWAITGIKVPSYCSEAGDYE